MPFRTTDPNGNRSQDAFDALGSVVGSAVMGKTTETVGDSLVGFIPDLDEAVLLPHLANPFADPAGILGAASSRVVYDFFAYSRTRDKPQPDPAVAYTLR